MMNRERKKIAFVGVFVVLVSMLAYIHNGNIAFAASCFVKLDVDKEQIEKGDSFLVSLNLDAKEAITGAEMMISYDADVMELVDASPVITGGDGILKVSDVDIAGERASITYKMKFKALKCGTSYMKLSDPMVYGESSGQSMSVASTILTIDVISQIKMSSNTKLSSLKVSGGTMEPEFSGDITEYTVTMAEDAEKIYVSAIPEDTKAIVDVKAPNPYTDGENDVIVTVKAENGDTKEYKITAMRKKKDTEQGTQSEAPKEDEEKIGIEEITNKVPDKETIPQNDLTVVKTKEGITIQTYAKYQVKELKNTSILPEGYEKTTVMMNGYEVTAYKSKNKSSDFALIYASRQGESPELYEYDIIEHTLQRYHDEKDISIAAEDASEEGALKSEYHGKLVILSAVLFMGIGLFLILIVVIIRLVIKNRQND